MYSRKSIISKIASGKLFAFGNPQAGMQFTEALEAE
jgi:hypothetical protein